MEIFVKSATSPTVSLAVQMMNCSAESVRVGSKPKMENAFVRKMERRSTPMENASLAMCWAANPAQWMSQRLVLPVEMESN